jgi:hypothetical protein
MKITVHLTSPHHNQKATWCGEPVDKVNSTTVISDANCQQCHLSQAVSTAGENEFSRKFPVFE